MSDLGAKALLVEEGSETPALESAAELDIEVLRLGVEDGAPAGTFTLSEDSTSPMGEGGMSQAIRGGCRIR